MEADAPIPLFMIVPPPPTGRPRGGSIAVFFIAYHETFLSRRVPKGP
jgi:hypothetical protein